jgi:hypothetical protein
MAGRVTDRDRGAQALMKRLRHRGKQRLTVGLHEAEGEAPHEGEDGGGELTVLDVGLMHEFGGDPGPPRRSFIAEWADESAADHQELLRRIARAVVRGELPSIENGLERFGLRAVGEVQARIKSGIEPPLDGATIDRKGSSTPLIDKGQLWTSIRHKLEKG